MKTPARTSRERRGGRQPRPLLEFLRRMAPPHETSSLINHLYVCGTDGGGRYTKGLRPEVTTRARLRIVGGAGSTAGGRENLPRAV